MKAQSRRDRQSSRGTVPSEADPLRHLLTILTVAMAATPLALVTGVFISHDVIPKVLLMTAAAASLLFLFPLWTAALGSLWRTPSRRVFLVLVLLQIVSLLVSTVLSGQISLSLAGTVWRRFGLVGQTATLLIAVGVVSVARLRAAWIPRLLRAIVVCGSIAAVYGILQYFDLDPILDRRLYAIDYFGGIARPPSTMGHALYFSAYLVPVLFIAIALASSEAVALWRRFYVLSAALSAIAIILSATRSAIGAAIIGGVFLAWRALRQESGGLRAIPVKYVGVVAGTFLVISAFVISPAGGNLRHRMTQWRQDSGGPRLQMWKECPALIAAHPLFGEGPDTFAGEFREIESLQLSRTYPDFYNETPHNALLDAACVQGIPGALILAAVFLLPWWARRGVSSAPNPIRNGLHAAMLGILISSMFASLTLVTSLYLWTIAGLTVVMEPDISLDTGEPLAEDRETWGLPRLVPVAFGAVYLVLGAILALQDAAWSRMGAAVEKGDFAGARDAYSSAISAGMGLPGYELWGSREWALLGRSLATVNTESSEAKEAWKLAADASRRAENKGEERFSAAYQSSVLAVAAADLPRAESEAREAIRLAPNWYKGHLLLSQILQYMGRNEQSAHEAELSVNMGWRK